MVMMRMTVVKLDDLELKTWAIYFEANNCLRKLSLEETLTRGSSHLRASHLRKFSLEEIYTCGT